MKKIIINILVLFVCFNSFGQTDTSLNKKQKGFLFLSSYNFLYDKISGEIRPAGFHDYFFLSENFDKKCFLDSNKNISFKNGVRVEFFKSRNQLKNKAVGFDCKEEGCYEYDKFYIIPVTIDYKSYEDSWPLACRSEFFDIEIIKGSKLRFYHQHKAVTITKIIVQSIIKKKAK